MSKMCRIKKLLTFQKLTLQTLSPSKSNFQTSHNSPFKPSNIHRSTEARPNRIQTIWRGRVCSFQAHWMMCLKNYKFDLVRLAQLNLLLKHVFTSLRFQRKWWEVARAAFYSPAAALECSVEKSRYVLLWEQFSTGACAEHWFLDL